MILRSVLQPISVERRISFESKSLPIRPLDLLLLGDSSRETLKKNHKPPLSIFVSFLCSHLLPLDAFLPLVCRFFDSHFSFLPLVSLSTHSGFYIPREKKRTTRSPSPSNRIDDSREETASNHEKVDARGRVSRIPHRESSTNVEDSLVHPLVESTRDHASEYTGITKIDQHVHDTPIYRSLITRRVYVYVCTSIRASTGDNLSRII